MFCVKKCVMTKCKPGSRIATRPPRLWTRSLAMLAENHGKETQTIESLLQDGTSPIDKKNENIEMLNIVAMKRKVESQNRQSKRSTVLTFHFPDC